MTTVPEPWHSRLIKAIKEHKAGENRMKGDEITKLLSTKNLMRLLRVRLLHQEQCRHLAEERKEKQRHIQIELGQQRKIDRYLAPLGQVKLRPIRADPIQHLSVTATFYIDRQMAYSMGYQADPDYLWRELGDSLAHSFEKQLRIVGISGLRVAAENAQEAPNTILWPPEEL